MKRSEWYNDKYAEFVADCVRDIINLLKDNNVKEITFERRNPEGIEPATAVFYDMSEVPQDIVKMTLCGEDEAYYVKVESSTCVGYIEDFYTDGFRDWYIFDIFRAVSEAIKAGQFVKNEG